MLLIVARALALSVCCVLEPERQNPEREKDVCVHTAEHAASDWSAQRITELRRTKRNMTAHSVYTAVEVFVRVLPRTIERQVTRKKRFCGVSSFCATISEKPKKSRVCSSCTAPRAEHATRVSIGDGTGSYHLDHARGRLRRADGLPATI
jgi:hypothetical protein